MSGALHFDTYDSGLGREQMLCVGEAAGPRLLIIPPLFDEMNRMRRTLVMAMRTLAERGIASALPDLPGVNESLAPLSQCRLSDWMEAMGRAADAVGATHIAAIRTACLLDGGLCHLPRWHYATLAGERLVTHMVRTQLAGDKAVGRGSTRADYEPVDADVRLNLGGYHLTAGLLADLREAVPSPLAEGRDLAVAGGLGPALWLRAEPGESADMARNLAAHWAEWMAA